MVSYLKVDMKVNGLWNDDPIRFFGLHMPITCFYEYNFYSKYNFKTKMNLNKKDWFPENN